MNDGIYEKLCLVLTNIPDGVDEGDSYTLGYRVFSLFNQLDLHSEPVALKLANKIRWILFFLARFEAYYVNDNQSQTISDEIVAGLNKFFIIARPSIEKYARLIRFLISDINQCREYYWPGCAPITLSMKRKLLYSSFLYSRYIQQ